MRQFHRIARVTLAAALMLGTAGVAAAQSPAASLGAPALAGTDWVLTSTGAGGNQTPVPAGVSVSLQIDEAPGGALAGGSGGCNRYMAPVTITDSALTFGPAASTLMACPDPQGSFEQQYFTALSTVATYAIAGQTLTLSDASGAAVLVFEAAPSATVEGAWVVTGYNNGNQGVETPPDGAGLTADFAPDGTVSGNGGCNSFSGGYSYTADTIHIGPLMSTMMACDDATNTLEQQYLTALQNATVWAIQGGSLELRDDSDALQVSFARP
jgi:heat shock protein HslJ